jgi:predicted aldo/keto reductase-like oxidoreductase
MCGEDENRVIDQASFNAMVDAYLAAGFTYFDTAYFYHKETSEGALKKALVDRYPRESYLIADKMPTVIVKCPEDYPRLFALQLERTGVQYFDYYLMHNLGKDRYETAKKFGGFDFVLEKKAEGKVKHLGFSFHDDAETLDKILTEQPFFEFVQLQMNYLDWESAVIQSRKCYEVAKKHGKSVIVMEPVKGGKLANLPEEALHAMREVNPTASPASFALRFVASLDDVMMVLSGMSNMEQLEENMALFDDLKPLSEEETNMLVHVAEIINGEATVPCTSCAYCTEVCPKRIPIPTLFGLYNNYKTTGGFNTGYYERAIYNAGKASDCIGCRLCEKNCPQHIKIADELVNLRQFEK